MSLSCFQSLVNGKKEKFLDHDQLIMIEVECFFKLTFLRLGHTKEYSMQLLYFCNSNDK